MVEREDVAAYIAADRAFHAELVSQAGNPLLTRMIMEARDTMRLYGIDTGAGRKRQVTSVAEHYRLVELVAGRQGRGGRHAAQPAHRRMEADLHRSAGRPRVAGVDPRAAPRQPARVARPSQLWRRSSTQRLDPSCQAI